MSMPLESEQKIKRPQNAERPFPWRCRHCGNLEVQPGTTRYTATVRHDGRLHTFDVSELRLPICRSCGELVFTGEADRQVTEGLRSHLNLLTPDEIRAALARLGMSQKEAAGRLGVAEETLSRWVNEFQIQSRAMDNLLRLFFTFPVVREALSGDAPVGDEVLRPVAG